MITAKAERDEVVNVDSASSLVVIVKPFFSVSLLRAVVPANIESWR